MHVQIIFQKSCSFPNSSIQCSAINFGLLNIYPQGKGENSYMKRLGMLREKFEFGVQIWVWLKLNETPQRYHSKWNTAVHRPDYQLLFSHLART